MAVFKRLKSMGMVQMKAIWVPYKLKPRDVKRHFSTCQLLLQWQRRKIFFLYCFVVLSGENHGAGLVTHQHQQQNHSDIHSSF